MLKITIRQDPSATAGVIPRTLELEGKIAGPWVEELEKAWRHEVDQAGAPSVTVSLRCIGFVDAGGKALLARMVQAGTRVEGSGCMTRALIEDVVRTVRGWAQGAHGSGKKTLALFFLAALAWGAALTLRQDSGSERLFASGGDLQTDVQTEGARS